MNCPICVNYKKTVYDSVKECSAYLCRINSDINYSWDKCPDYQPKAINSWHKDIFLIASREHSTSEKCAKYRMYVKNAYDGAGGSTTEITVPLSQSERVGRFLRITEWYYSKTKFTFDLLVTQNFILEHKRKKMKTKELTNFFNYGGK